VSELDAQAVPPTSALTTMWAAISNEREGIVILRGKVWRARETRHLTVKLRGRPEAPGKRRGRTLSYRACGAEPQAHRGHLQRLLEVI
jgi:hypothetical protein